MTHQSRQENFSCGGCLVSQERRVNSRTTTILSNGLSLEVTVEFQPTKVTKYLQIEIIKSSSLSEKKTNTNRSERLENKLDQRLIRHFRRLRVIAT